MLTTFSWIIARSAASSRSSAKPPLPPTRASLMRISTGRSGNAARTQARRPRWPGRRRPASRWFPGRTTPRPARRAGRPAAPPGSGCSRRGSPPGRARDRCRKRLRRPAPATARRGVSRSHAPPLAGTTRERHPVLPPGGDQGEPTEKRPRSVRPPGGRPPHARRGTVGRCPATAPGCQQRRSPAAGHIGSSTRWAAPGTRRAAE